MRARLIVFPPLWFLDSYDPDRSYALTSHSGEEFIEGLTDATWKGPDSNSNLAKSAPPSGTPLFFFNASTRRSWVIRGTGVREHSYFSARMCTREKSVRFFLLRRKKSFFSLEKSAVALRQALRVALRCVTCRLTLYCRGNGCSDTMFHGNITIRRQIRSAIGVNDTGRENGERTLFRRYREHGLNFGGG